MNKQVVITFVAIFAITFGLIWFGIKQITKPVVNGSEGLVSQLRLNENFHDFGTISMAKGNVSKTFTLTNIGSSTIKIVKVDTSCMCTEAFVVNGSQRLGPFGMLGHGGAARSISDSVAPTQSREIEVVFDPAAHGPSGVGPIERVVRVVDDSGAITEIGFKAVVTP